MARVSAACFGCFLPWAVVFAQEEVAIDTVVVDAGTRTAQVKVHATTRGGPLQGFVLPVQFDPDRLTILDFRPSGAWVVADPPGLVEAVGTQSRRGLTGQAALSVIVDMQGDPDNAVPQAPAGESQEIATIECEILTPAGQGKPCDAIELVDNRVAFGSGPRLVTSLVIGGDDYHAGDPNHRLLRRSGSLSVAVPLALDTPEETHVSRCNQVLRQIEVPPATDDVFVFLQKRSGWQGRLEVRREGDVVSVREGQTDFMVHLESPESGSYLIVLSGPNSGRGVLSALTSLPALVLNPDSWTIGRTLRQQGSAWYEVDGPPGETSLTVKARGIGNSNRLRVFRDSINTVAKASVRGVEPEVSIQNPGGGTYYVEFTESANGLAGGDLRHLITAFTASEPALPDAPPVIANFFPTSGGIPGPVTVSVRGSGFRSDTSSRLTRNGAPDLLPTSQSVLSEGRELKCTFDFSEAEPGHWELSVENGQASVIATEPFEIVPGGRGELWAEVLGRSVIRAGQEQAYTIAYGNRGTIDIDTPLLTFSTSHGVPVRRSMHAPTQESPLRILGAGEGGSPATLSPGSTHFVVVYVPTSVDFLSLFSCEVGAVGDSDSPFDWDRLGREGVPTGFSPPVWAATVDLARSRIGESWAEVMTAVRTVITDSGQDVSSLRNFDELLLYVITVYGTELPDGPEDGLGAGIDDFDVDVVAQPPVNPNPSHTFVITHGLGGTETGDRHHQLAEQIRAQFPKANVYRVDWTPGADKTVPLTFGRIPNPRAAAQNINLAGDKAASALGQLIDPMNSTFIGESFGNYVNNRIAKELGGVDKILAFNPAHEYGGYPPPDLRDHSDQAWSFHTYSMYDTHMDIADHRLRLDTRDGAGSLEQHIFGIEWLRQRLANGDTSWILFNKSLASLPPGLFDGSAELDGTYDPSIFANRFDPLYDTVAPNPTVLKALPVRVVRAIDPEDKFGPAGYDTPETPSRLLSRYVPEDQRMTYRVEFWNHEEASARVQDVLVDDQLDENLDWSTFRFEEFGFLEYTFPLEDTQYFSFDIPELLPLDEDGDGQPDEVDGSPLLMLVSAEGTFNVETGFIHCAFHSLNPLTRELPADPEAGFLPPVTEGGEELAWVTYSVLPREGLESGTRITNVAYVKFDVCDFRPAPTCTPPQEQDPPPCIDPELPLPCPYFNTIDSGVPDSAVRPLADLQLSSTFKVEWEGQDEESGSGIRHIDIWVSEDSGEPMLWRNDTTERSAEFTGIPGRSYCFYSVATDNVGHVERVPPDPDACTALLQRRFQRGNANGANEINLTDAVFVFNFLFLGGAVPPCLDAADINDDSTMNLTDGVYLLNFLFLGGPPPPAPHSDCGVDPTEEDGLECSGFRACP